jgi:hypothetical protein
MACAVLSTWAIAPPMTLSRQGEQRLGHLAIGTPVGVEALSKSHPQFIRAM